MQAAYKKKKIRLLKRFRPQRRRTSQVPTHNSRLDINCNVWIMGLGNSSLDCALYYYNLLGEINTGVQTISHYSPAFGLKWKNGSLKKSQTKFNFFFFNKASHNKACMTVYIQNTWITKIQVLILTLQVQPSSNNNLLFGWMLNALRVTIWTGLAYMQHYALCFVHLCIIIGVFLLQPESASSVRLFVLYATSVLVTIHNYDFGLATVISFTTWRFVVLVVGSLWLISSL